MLIFQWITGFLWSNLTFYYWLKDDEFWFDTFEVLDFFFEFCFSWDWERTLFWASLRDLLTYELLIARRHVNKKKIRRINGDRWLLVTFSRLKLIQSVQYVRIYSWLLKRIRREAKQLPRDRENLYVSKYWNLLSDNMTSLRWFCKKVLRSPPLSTAFRMKVRIYAH